jgi:hypothetical protein
MTGDRKLAGFGLLKERLQQRSTVTDRGNTAAIDDSPEPAVTSTGHAIAEAAGGSGR